jgi:mRNA interferase RelE/StbE
MTVSFKPAFVRGFNDLASDVRQEVKIFCTEVIPTARDLKSISGYDIKPLSGYKNYYRVKLGEHRIGFKKEGGSIIFMRVLDRKDIYKHFP